MATIDEAVFFSTLSEINAKLKAREFSALELARAWCDRLEKFGPRYNALALSLREPALKLAKDADRELKRERHRGLLQGVPYGAKDLLAVAGHPTTWGAKPYATQVFEEDATVIKKLRGAGALLTGKLAMVELAGGGGYRFPAASLQGPGLNPWNRGHWSGGSSSGSGSAVAAGLVAYALGSETSGSIITPAAFCGVTGLRPTYGLVSRAGAMALSWTLDKIGPLARSAEDCGVILQAIAGGDSADPGSAGKGFYYAPQYQRPLSKMRVGYAPVDFDEWVDPAAKGAFAEALGVVKALGVEMVEVSLPDLPYGLLVSTIISGEAGSIFEQLITSGRVNELADQKQIAGLKASHDVSAKDYLKAMRVRAQVILAMRKVFQQADVLLMPSRNGPASKIDEPLDRAPGRSMPKAPGLRNAIPAGNLAGLPALSLPCGFANGLPVGISLMTRAFNENMILAIGKAFQERTDWHRRRPPTS